MNLCDATHPKLPHVRCAMLADHVSRKQQHIGDGYSWPVADSERDPISFGSVKMTLLACLLTLFGAGGIDCGNYWAGGASMAIGVALVVVSLVSFSETAKGEAE